MKEWIVKDTLNNKYVQELVRCKDCKHYEPDRLFECNLHGACQPKPDWFCADGERMQNLNE